MTLYRDIISKALAQSWRHKYIWFLAFFAALAGNGGEYELIFSGSDSINGQSYILGILRAFYESGTIQQIQANIQSFFGTYPIPAVFLVFLLILLALVVVWIVIVAQAALFWALTQLQSKSDVSFAEAFNRGTRYFSPIFLLNLVTKLIILGIIFCVALPFGMAYIRTGVVLYNSLYILAVLIALIPVSVVFSFVVKYASLYVVVKNQSWRTAFKSGWLLFVRNWLVSLEVALVLFVINLVTSLVLVFLLVQLGLISNPVSTIVFFAILTVFGAFLASFQYGTWVQLFFSLEAGSARAKLMRWSDRLIGRTATPTTPPAK
jgi:hypothetical protein